ncbi:MAG: type II 3-dehydroquinate dehydratase [Bacteroidales bacterium]|nr:type II 3-dehydroquinate dehydratase [Bacteroidales bacterium]MCR5066174.1 type II 3-dehydroquinate dehydratase [Bacteroidales bacterium]
MKRVAIINGPNLNLTGVREREVYGNMGMEEFVAALRKRFADVEIGYFQSNIEGEIVDEIQRAGFATDGIVINAGGYSHTSVAIHDALKAVPAPSVEVHISNIFAREEYRHHSLVTPACRGMICGLGLKGYELAIECLIEQ